GGRAVERAGGGRARGVRRAVRRIDRRPRVRGAHRRAEGGLRARGHHGGAGWFDPALQRLQGDLSRRGDHADRRRGAEVPHPRAERERRSVRDREHGRRRGAVPPEVRRLEAMTTTTHAAAPARTSGATVVLFTLAAGQFLMTLDSSVMNVSIATVAKDV